MQASIWYFVSPLICERIPKKDSSPQLCVYLFDKRAPSHFDNITKYTMAPIATSIPAKIRTVVRGENLSLFPRQSSGERKSACISFFPVRLEMRFLIGASIARVRRRATAIRRCTVCCFFYQTILSKKVQVWTHLKNCTNK